MLHANTIPKYIQEIAERLKFAPYHLQDSQNYGYTFVLYGKYKVGYESRLEREANQLVRWSERHHAESYISKENYWHSKYDNVNKAYAANHHNYVTIVITDPVAQVLEQAGFIKMSWEG